MLIRYYLQIFAAKIKISKTKLFNQLFDCLYKSKFDFDKSLAADLIPLESVIWTSQYKAKNVTFPAQRNNELALTWFERTHL